MPTQKQIEMRRRTVQEQDAAAASEGRGPAHTTTNNNGASVQIPLGDGPSSSVSPISSSNSSNSISRKRPHSLLSLPFKSLQRDPNRRKCIGGGALLLLLLFICTAIFKKEADSEMSANPRQHLNLLGSSYCTYSPDYGCYVRGWPNCCLEGRKNKCPKEHPPCEVMPEASKKGDVSVTTTTANEKRSSHKRPPLLIYAIGLVRSMSQIQPDILRFLAELNCNHGVSLHIVAGDYGSAEDRTSSSHTDLDHYRSRIVDEQSRIPTSEPHGDDEDAQDQDGKTSNQHRDEFAGCAPVDIVTEDVDAVYGPNKHPPTNRVERIAALRDYQRELLRPHFIDGKERATTGIDQGAVIVIDLDLAALPPPERVMDVANKLAGNSAPGDKSSGGFPYDAICAAGVTAASKHELWYYDTYATILWPDTYLHPLQRRLIKRHYAGENPALVRSDDRNGNWTQGDIMRYLQTKANESKEKEEEEEKSKEYAGTVEVKSCFGGMAIYRASVWFESKCRYGMDPSTDDRDDDAGVLMRYASEADGRPCEHVVFHDCLIGASRASTKGEDNALGSSRRSRIAIMPKLLTLWKKDGKTTEKRTPKNK